MSQLGVIPKTCSLPDADGALTVERSLKAYTELKFIH